MNPSLLILFFLADNRKYMLSRWDFSVRVFCFRHCRVYFRHCRVYSRHCQKYTRQCRKQANLISAVSFCYVYDLFLAKKNTPDYLLIV